MASREERVYLSVGSNIHPRVQNIQQALSRLRAVNGVNVIDESHWYETQPWESVIRPIFTMFRYP
ncbi:2-amino-4-hydroxy-6-hydroxymethyldihydropteridine diphosphokinase [Lactiplantibacillus plantarum]|nr:2-amino-4-hydroxy-6-hydroxymethyldihydropteridine diphosphokinase [Lactiplantibacillus plantarum]